MSKSAISGFAWAEMSEAQRVASVRDGRASLKEIVAGLLDGPDVLQEACRAFLAQTDASFEKLRVQIETDHQALPPNLTSDQEPGQVIEELISDYPVDELLDSVPKRRLGLPKGYVPRLYRH